MASPVRVVLHVPQAPGQRDARWAAIPRSDDDHLKYRAEARALLPPLSRAARHLTPSCVRQRNAGYAQVYNLHVRGVVLVVLRALNANGDDRRRVGTPINETSPYRQGRAWRLWPRRGAYCA